MERGQSLPAMKVKDPGGYTKTGPTEPQEKEGVRNAVGGGLGDKVQGTETTLGEAVASGDLELPEEETQSSEAQMRRPTTKLRDKNEPDDPWKQARGGPSEEWQPTSWEGSVAPRRRS